MKTIIKAIKNIFYSDFTRTQFDYEDNISIELDDDYFFERNTRS